MKYTQLYDVGWLVEDVFPPEIIKECQQQDIDSFEWESLGKDMGKFSQEHTVRRMLICKEPNVFARLNSYVLELIPTIQEITNKQISYSDTRIWADYPGYIANRHLDNDLVYITMQVYLNEGDIDLGTHFSNKMIGQYPYKIPYKPNTGYIMVNSDHSFHGMIKSVPDNFIRLSSYTWFYV